MKALIIGATGATGKDLIHSLLQNEAYTEIAVFVRKELAFSHPKVITVITDFDNLETISSSVYGDVLFSCLGTTLKLAGSRDRQWHIDFEIPLRFAEIAKRNNVPRVVLLSAYGAKENSPVYYSMIKGELEKYMRKVGFEQYIIFKPGMLLRKDTDRSGERISAMVLKFFNRLGLIRKFKPLPTELLAEKLAKAPLILPPGMHVIELEKIWSF